MIGALRGCVQTLNNSAVLVFAAGVGYKVALSRKNQQVINSSEENFFYIYTHVKEDSLELYGFKEKEELELFELLIQVSGVGPKTAMLIMEFDQRQIKKAVMSSDVEFFLQIPRIGRKNAQKIIIELKSKVGSLIDLDLTAGNSGETNEVIEALTAMGFKRGEVNMALRKISAEAVTVEQKIREALKMLGR